MAYCGPRGIALSVFLRWEQADQDAALDWLGYESARCKGCGTHPDEWETPESFHAHPVQCKGCQAQQRVSDALQSHQERGMFATTVSGSARDCLRCQPDDD
jgi:hypothetical protein